MEIVQSINLISISPDVRGGRPCIANTGLRVTDVAIAAIFHQRTPGEIASDYGITLAQVHAALAYYYEHKANLDDDIRNQFEKARELKEKHIASRTPSLLS